MDKASIVIDRQNTAPSATPIITSRPYQSAFKEDFSGASRDFWKYNDPDKMDSYSMGEVVAKFGKNVKTLGDLLERIQNIIAESIREDLKKKGKTTADLKISLDNLKVAMDIVARDTERLSKDVDINRIGAVMHGFMNTYVNTQIAESIERKKGMNEIKRQ